MELQAVTGQLYIVDGNVQDASTTPGLLVQAPPSKAVRGREHDTLFVHLSLSGKLDETSVLAQDLLEAITETYYSTSGSVTAALRKALIKCNTLLLNWNLSGVSPTREGAICCAALRGEELYMAQAGESYAVLGHNIGTKRLPAKLPQQITPLGRTAGLDIRLYHEWLQAGDAILLADPRLDYLPGDAINAVLTEMDLEEGLEQLGHLVGEGSARLILVEVTDEPPAFVPDISSARKSRSKKARLDPPSAIPIRERRSQPEADTQVSGSELAHVNAETLETAARRATGSAALVLSRVTGWTADILSFLKPKREGSTEETNWPLLSVLAIIIPFITASVVAGVYVRRGRVVQLGEIRRYADQSLSQGYAAGDDTSSAVRYFEEALRIADEGLRLRPGDNDLNTLRLKAQQELDGIAGVARLGSRILFEYPLEANLDTIALGDEVNGGIYVNDLGRSLVLRHETGEKYLDFDPAEPETIVFSQQAIGNHVAGSIIDMFWRPRGNAVSRDGLAMLDANGALITYFPNFADLRAVALGLSSQWQQPIAVASFNERVYVLDIGAASIWRYLADMEGFQITEDLQSIAFVDQADLPAAVDLEIYSEDGSVIILYSDGRIGRYASGRLLWDQSHVQDNGLRMPLVRPIAIRIVGQGLNSSIFVADPDSERIVQLSLAGTFLAQYKATDENGGELFATITDFAVVENPFRIFVIAGNKLYVTSQS